MSRANLQMSEAAWQTRVIDTAIRLGWHVHHSKPAPTIGGKRFITHIEGHPGLPDLVLARSGVVLLVELKRTGKSPTPAQRSWLAAAGAHGRVWTPAQWDEALAELRGNR